jgi:ATP-binding protein involved in chromosome partitioning
VGGVIENMAYLECSACGDRTYPFGEGGGRQLAETFEAPLLGQIPLDPRMRELADHGKPSVIATPDSASAREFERAVDNLVARFPAKKKSKARTTLPLIMQPPKAAVRTH